MRKYQWLMGGIGGFVVGVFLCVILTVNGANPQIGMLFFYAGGLGLLVGFIGTLASSSVRSHREAPAEGDPTTHAISTQDLLMYLIVILAWEISAALWFVNFVGPRPNAARFPLFVLVGATVALTVFATLKCKSTFQSLRHTRGDIPMTRLQAFLAAAVMLCFCFFLTWVGIMLFG